MLPAYCAGCVGLVDAKMRELAGERDANHAAAVRRAEWATIRPDLFEDTDLRRIDPKAVDAARAWKFGSMGLALVGNTGAGKSRLLYWMLEHFHLSGRSVVIVRAKQFEKTISQKSGDSMRELDAYTRGLVRCDILAIDDLGKERATERVETELLDVLDSRTLNLRPFLFTSQFSDEELSAHYSPDVGSAIVRRLKQFCQPVNVRNMPLP